MAAVGESSEEVGEKPVIVRVKRKVGQSPLDAFFSMNVVHDDGTCSSVAEEVVKPKKVLVRHLETVTDTETTTDVFHSLFESHLKEHNCSKRKSEERKIAFKKPNRNLQCLTKAVQQKQIAAESARFEQIWWSRKGNKDKELHERCNLYDVIRVDAEEKALQITTLEDQKMLASFLPLLRECIPSAAEEIEADIHSSHTEEYVYDYYALNDDMDISEDGSNHQFPLVKVEEEEELCDGPDESDYDTEDSNAEDHPRNDYPQETSEEEEEEKDDDDDEEDEIEKKSEGFDESEDEETLERHVRKVLGDDDAEDVNGYKESDDEDFEYTKWSYR